MAWPIGAVFHRLGGFGYNDAMNDTPKLRWYRLTPNWPLLALLAAEGFLLGWQWGSSFCHTPSCNDPVVGQLC